MADAKRCDRCKEFYDKLTYKDAERTNGVIVGIDLKVLDEHSVSVNMTNSTTVRNIDITRTDHIDLCPSCVSKFCAFLKNENIQDE